MKKFLSTLIILGIFFTVLSPVKAVKYPIRVVVNGERITFPDAQPYIDEYSRTQVPVRFVSEALDGKVSWDEETQTVTIKRYRDTITLTIGEKEIKVNGEIKKLDTKAVIIEDRTFVPVRFVSEAMGATVTWDQEIFTAYIDIGKDKDSQDKKEPGELIEHKGGYLVPYDSQLIVSNSDSEVAEQCFLIDFTLVDADVPQQMIDLKTAIKSKFGEKVANEVYEHVSKKKTPKVYLEEKRIYVKEFDQYILIQASGKGTRGVSMVIYHPGINPKDIKI